ncbi:MAG: hypothetical protein RLZZ370_1121, partial [Bacteroidota bacterium]
SLSLVCRLFPGKDVQQGGFACSVARHQSCLITPRQSKADVAEQFTVTKGFTQLFNG